MAKKKFEFVVHDGLVDIYLDGMKVRAGHNGSHGHVYLPLDSDHVCTVQEADTRIGIGAEIIERKLVPFKPVHKPLGEPIGKQPAMEVRKPGSGLKLDARVPRNDTPVPRGE